MMSNELSRNDDERLEHIRQNVADELREHYRIHQSMYLLVCDIEEGKILGLTFNRSAPHD